MSESGSGPPSPAYAPVLALKRRSRRANFTHAEIDALVFGYRSNRTILDSKGNGPLGTLGKQRVWERITRQLFAVSGIRRAASEVKKKWSDLKSQRKKGKGHSKRPRLRWIHLRASVIGVACPLGNESVD